MGNGLTRRIRAVFGTKDQPGLELVMAANGIATLAIVGFDHVPSGRWIGAAIGGLGGFAAGMWTSLRVVSRAAGRSG